jgi:L-lactate dehydrogenase complex protein LldG
MSRNEILGRIRTANANRPVQRLPEIDPPAGLVSYGSDTVSRFCSAAMAKGVTIVEPTSQRSLPEAIAQALSTAHMGQRHIRLSDAAFENLPWSDAGLGIERGAAAPHDTVTLSRALAAVAETGTLVLASSPSNPTTLAFLAETHLVVVERMSILGTFEEAIALLRQTFGTALPRTVNFISGASRTGDIGGRIVHGAHGPRHLIVFII